VTAVRTRSPAGEEATSSGNATAGGTPPPTGGAARRSAFLATARTRSPTGEFTCSATVTTVVTRSSAGLETIASSTRVITYRPPRPGLTSIRPADDQRSRRRRTLEGLQRHSSASSAVLISLRFIPTSHAKASSSLRARSGTILVFDVAVRATVAPSMKQYKS